MPAANDATTTFDPSSLASLATGKIAIKPILRDDKKYLSSKQFFFVEEKKQ